MSADREHPVVIDTNVLAVAEGMHGKASDLCRAACVQIARQVQQGRPVSVDTGDRIVSEYFQVLKDAETSSVGKKLALRLYRLRHDPKVCRQVEITPTEFPGTSFVEVPETLKDFDIDDHMFIAVAASDDAVILQSLDKEWWERRKDFAKAGVDVQFLCIGDLLEATTAP
jgi:hypothetical protein